MTHLHNGSDFSELNPGSYFPLYEWEQQIPKENVESINFRKVHMYPKTWKVIKSVELFINIIT